MNAPAGDAQGDKRAFALFHRAARGNSTGAYCHPAPCCPYGRGAPKAGGGPQSCINGRPPTAIPRPGSGWNS